MSVALFNAITGLTNFQKVLDTVGNNLANMSTPGYKRNSVVFKEMLSQTLQGASRPNETSGGSNPLQIGLGSSIGAINTSYTQGLLEVTGRPTDLAITGNGFFMVRSGANRIGYTRNGSFSVDVDGNMVDNSGNILQGWVATNGLVDSSQAPTDIAIPVGESTNARATTTASFSGNLDATQANGATHVVDSIIYDSLGKEHTLSVTYTKVDPPVGAGASEWNFAAQIDGSAAGNGTIAFSTDGQFDAANSSANPQANLVIGSGADPLSVDLDWSEMTQLASSGEYSVSLYSQDGVETGSLESFAIDNYGNIVGSYSNGLTELIGQISLADFSNPEGLEKGAGGVLWQTSNTGTPSIGTPGSGSRGQLNAGSLELSNVDMSTEFTKMIIAQRAFQANSRVVSVMDDVLEEMANLKR